MLRSLWNGADELQNLLLDVTSNAVVGSSQISKRAHRPAHGDHDPLLHPPGKLVGILPHAPLRQRNAHLLQ